MSETKDQIENRLMAAVKYRAGWALTDACQELEAAGLMLELARKRAEAAEKRVAELEAEQRWIPVSERLPKESNAYLVYSPDVPDGAGTKVWQVAYYAWRTPKMEFTTGYTVTHWMPLPKSPKEEVEE